MDQHVKTAVRRGTDNAEHLQFGLRNRQQDLRALEEALLSSKPQVSPMTLIDQAEDLHRALTIHADEHVPEIRRALEAADSAIMDAAVRGDLAPEQSRTLTHMVTVAGEETRRLQLDLADARRSLERTAHASPADPRLRQNAADSIDQATHSIQQGQRSIFRVTQDLPFIERQLQEVGQQREKQTAIDVDLPDLSLRRSPHASERAQTTPGVEQPRRAAPGI